jgi:YggT family protein
MYALFWLIDTVLWIYFWIIIIMAILSWLIAFDVVNRRNDLVYSIWTVCDRLTAPLLAPIRRVLPNLGGLDISPVILLLIIQFIRILLASDVYPALMRIAY